jgi:glycerol-3-phosphate O-acyltransferase
MDPFKKLANHVKERELSPQLGAVIRDFYLSYIEAAQENGYDSSSTQQLLNTFLDLVLQQQRSPWHFAVYHEHVLHPFNYTQFGLDLFRRLVIFPKSKLVGKDNVDSIQQKLEQGENAILFGNHQTEPDPQAIILMLEKNYPRLAKEMIFVAGHRVTTDPLAVPFSLGINLLCVYSKRHIEADPALKEERQLHNQRTMKKMLQLLGEGGKCIYIAPSGGRDRLNSHGRPAIAPFDPQSIEMCRLMGQKCGKTTHFFPLSLSTYHLLPPPSAVQYKLGEERHAHSTPIHLAFGGEIEMAAFPGAKETEKKELKQKRAEYIWDLVAKNYEKLQ